uniref:Uncharacterized protein n=1 Tax=Rhizophora mucronata TaxID=61149 RepID=A0A2P2P0E5_RHIMU
MLPSQRFLCQIRSLSLSPLTRVTPSN